MVMSNNSSVDKFSGESFLQIGRRIGALLCIVMEIRHLLTGVHGMETKKSKVTKVFKTTNDEMGRINNIWSICGHFE
jgi:hypothetical protein